MRALRALTVAAVKEYVRDRMALFWTLAFPILFILIFGLLFSDPDISGFRVGVVLEDPEDMAAAGFYCQMEAMDRDEGGEAFPADDRELCQRALERAIAAGYVSSDTLRLRQQEQAGSEEARLPLYISRDSREEVLEALKQGDLAAAIVFPADFQLQMGRAFARGDPVPITIYYDASQPTRAQVLQGVLGGLFERFDQMVTQRPRILAPQFQPLQAEHLRTIDYMVPGILAVSLMQLGLFAAGTVVSLRERQILKRLGATPLPRSALVTSQVLFRLIIAVLQTVLIIVVGWLVFRVEVGNRLGMLALFVFLGALTFIAMGYVVAAFARTEESSVAIVQAIQFPMMFLSGVYFPIDFVPDWMQPVLYALPLTYLGDALRQVMVEASAWKPLWLDGLVLSAWLIVSLAISFRFFRWE